MLLEVSRVGVAESDDEIELSLELSIGGSYGKCEKPGQVMEESLSQRVAENVVVPSSGFSFSQSSVFGGEQVENGSLDPNRKREIQALRRLEARRKREEKMRKSSCNSRGMSAHDKAFLEAQQFQERAQDRKTREVESFLVDDKSARKKDNILLAINDEPTSQNHGSTQMRERLTTSKNGCVYLFGAQTCLDSGIVRNEENEIKEKYTFQPASFRPYFNRAGGNIVSQNSGTIVFDSCHNNGIGRTVNQKASYNGSLERSPSFVSDYRSTSGKARTVAGGSISDTGSHSSCLQANDRQLSITATSGATPHQHEVNGSRNKDSVRASRCTTPLERPMVSDAAIAKPDAKTNASTSNPANPTSGPPKQSTEVSESPSKDQSHKCGTTNLYQMPCVSTTGNGPNGKTITGFLYRYTKTEVSIVCVCHGSSFSPAEFVKHAGGTDVTDPLRHITMVPSSFGEPI